MAQLSTVHGVDEILKNLRKSRLLVAAGFERGLKRAGLFLQRESQLLVPVDTGNLKGSAFTRSFYKGTATEVYVGYTAEYAVYVHENLEAAHGAEYNRKYANKIGPDRDSSTGKYLSRQERRKKKFSARGERQQAKFLEQPAREKRPTILMIIYAEAKL